MKKKIFLFCSAFYLLLFANTVFSQIFEPVKWAYSTEQVGDNEYELVFSATIEDGWHLYSQYIKDGGPIPTSFNFEPVDEIELIEKVEERGELEEEYDPNFEMDLKYYSLCNCYNRKKEP